jgi:hypothetical protein
VHWAKLWSDTLGTSVRIPATAAALKCIDNKGGLDEYGLDCQLCLCLIVFEFLNCFFFLRYLLNSSPGQLASIRALELRQAIMFKKENAASASEQGVLPEAESASSISHFAPSLSARARPEARLAAAHAAELSAKRRAASMKQ